MGILSFIPDSMAFVSACNLSIWYRDGVSETILRTEGELEHVEAIIPRGESGRRFLRLNVLPATAQP